MKQLKEPKATERQTKKTASATSGENVESQSAESAGELYPLYLSCIKNEPTLRYTLLYKHAAITIAKIFFLNTISTNES